MSAYLGAGRWDRPPPARRLVLLFLAGLPLAGPRPARGELPALAPPRAATVLVEATSAAGVPALGSDCLAEAPGLVFTCSHLLGMAGPWNRPPQSVHVTLHAGTPRAA